MTAYSPPLDDIRFVLRHLVDLEGLGRLPGLEAATPDLVDQILDEAGRFAVDDAGAAQPHRRSPGRASRERRRAHARGLQGRLSEVRRRRLELGCNCPRSGAARACPGRVATAVWEMWNGANLAFCLCPMLTQARSSCCFGTAPRRRSARYLPKLVSGEWTGTMNLTEPQAGSDVGALTHPGRARGRPLPDHRHQDLHHLRRPRL